MSRHKIIMLTLSLIAGLGLSVGCSKEDNADNAIAEATKTTATKAKAKDEAAADTLPVEATGPVAIVNGAEVTAEEFNEAIKQAISSDTPGEAVSPLRALMLKHKTLDQLIDRELLGAAMEEVEVNSEEIDAEMEKLKENLPNQKEYEKYLEQRGLTETKMRENLVKDRKLRKLLKIEDSGEATEKEAKEMSAAQLKAQKFTAAMNKLMDDLIKGATIEWKDENIKMNATNVEGGPDGTDPQLQLQMQIMQNMFEEGKKKQQQRAKALAEGAPDPKLQFENQIRQRMQDKQGR